MALTAAWGLELDDPRGPFQPKPFYDSVHDFTQNVFRVGHSQWHSCQVLPHHPGSLPVVCAPAEPLHDLWLLNGNLQDLTSQQSHSKEGQGPQDPLLPKTGERVGYYCPPRQKNCFGKYTSMPPKMLPHSVCISLKHSFRLFAAWGRRHLIHLISL